MENNKKSQAELYREERKERLAKAAAKNAKNAPKTMKAKKLATKIIAIVLAVVVGLGAVYGVLSFFDVPEKVIKVSIDNADGTKTYKFSAGEYNYYYFTTWINFYQQAAQYEQYMGAGAGLMYTGFDYTKAPGDQEFTAETAEMLGVTMEELGNPEKPTWADVMLTLLHFGDNALLGAATLKTTQSTLQGFVFLNANFRHCFPSLRWCPAKSWTLSGPYRLDYYMLNFLFCQATFLPF